MLTKALPAFEDRNSVKATTSFIKSVNLEYIWCLWYIHDEEIILL